MEQIEQKIIIRVCKQCNEVKNINLFPTNRNKGNITYRHRCKDCEKIMRREQNKKYYDSKKTRANIHNMPVVACVAVV